jgi:hypothetical protein
MLDKHQVGGGIHLGTSNSGGLRWHRDTLRRMEAVAFNFRGETASVYLYSLTGHIDRAILGHSHSRLFLPASRSIRDSIVLTIVKALGGLS